jgi:hypothetical protein
MNRRSQSTFQRHPITPDRYDAILLNMDGVVTDTASIHATCWKTMS